MKGDPTPHGKDGPIEKSGKKKKKTRFPDEFEKHILEVPTSGLLSYVK